MKSLKVGWLKKILSLFDDENEIVIKINNIDKRYNVINASYKEGSLELRAFEEELDVIISELVSYL